MASLPIQINHRMRVKIFPSLNRKGPAPDPAKSRVRMEGREGATRSRHVLGKYKSICFKPIRYTPSTVSNMSSTPPRPQVPDRAFRSTESRSNASKSPGFYAIDFVSLTPSLGAPKAKFGTLAYTRALGIHPYKGLPRYYRTCTKMSSIKQKRSSLSLFIRKAFWWGHQS